MKNRFGIWAVVAVGVAVAGGGCAGRPDPSGDVASFRARLLPPDGLSDADLALPGVVVDSRGFRQTWGSSQSSLELADYVNELEQSAARIEQLAAVPPSWARLAGKFRDEARDKALWLMRAEGGVSQYNSILIPIAAAEGYKSAYEKTFREKHDLELEKNVRQIPLPALYDALIEGIRDGSLKGKLKPVGVDESSIPMRIVRKASQARSDAGCALDAGEKRGRKPSKLEQLFAYVWTDCYARRTMYRAVKDLLVTAKRNPKVQELLAAEFEKQFPPKFKEGFREGFSDVLAGAHLNLARKVDPARRADLFPSFNYLEPSTDQPDPDVVPGARTWVQLRQLGLLLGAQTQVAADLLDSQSREARVLGTIAAYGAMEKMFFLLGRPGAVFKNGKVLTQPQNPNDTRRGLSPQIVTELKGGSAFNLTTRKIESWDLDKDVAGDSASKIYPQWLAVDAQGRNLALPAQHVDSFQATSDLSTLVALIDGAMSFLELAHSVRTFGIKFGEAERVIDPRDRGVLFAKELRDLPLGVVATALKTIVSRHLVALDVEGKPLPSPQTPGVAGLSLRASSGAGAGVVLDAEATARAILALARVARALAPGGALESRSDLAAVKDQLSFALPFVTLNLGRNLQSGDGGFHAKFDFDRQSQIPEGPRLLGLQAVVLEAHLEVYRLYGTTAILKRAMKLLGFVKSRAMWSVGARFFRSQENAAESQFRAQDLLRLMSVCLLFREATGVAEEYTQAAQLASRMAEFLEEASLGKEFETLGLITP